MAELTYPKSEYIKAIMAYLAKTEEEAEEYFAIKIKQREIWRLDFMVNIVKTFYH